MTTNRTSLIVALSSIAVLAILTVSMIALPRPAASLSANGAAEQRRGEWTSGVTAEQAYLEQRHGEQTAGHAVYSNAAYQEFRRGEQMTGVYVNPEQAYLEFRHGEQTTGVNAALAYLEYRRGEWSGR